MKKWALGLLGLVVSTALYAADYAGSEQLDGKIFLDRYINELAHQTAAVSINIGTSLPSTRHIISTDVCKEVGLGAYFKNMAKDVTPSTRVVVTAPASFGAVFTDSSCEEGTCPGDNSYRNEKVYQHIQAVLAQVGASTDENTIQQNLKALTEVCHATFAIRNDMLTLVTDERELLLGEPVWRKNFDEIEKCIYHSEEEYLVAFANAGFVVEEIKRPCFCEYDYKQHIASLKEGEKGLGHSYVENHPFTIFYMARKSS